MPYVAYRYGLRRPENPEPVLQQMQAASKYRKTLVDIECRRRAALRALNINREDRDDPVVSEKIEAIHATARAERLQARAECGVYWGTYLIIENADVAARRHPLWFAKKPWDPEAPEWCGEGAVGVQISGGLGAEDLASSPFVRLIPRGDRRNSRRAMLRPRYHLWLRIGSDEKRRPIWGRWPMVMHRPLPEGARIQRVHVHRRLIGPREEWYAVFFLRLPDKQVVHPAASVACGISFETRALADGSMRVGALHGSDGSTEELILPAEVLSSIHRATTLHATRKQNMAQAMHELRAWLETVPECWLHGAAQHSSAWRGNQKFNALLALWKQNRVDGDQDMLDKVHAWSRQDKHLWLWESSQRVGALRRRRDVYRQMAARIARRYGTVVMVDAPVRSIEPQHDVEDAPWYAVRHTGLHELRLSIQNAVSSRGGTIHLVPPEPSVSSANSSDAARELLGRWISAAQSIGAANSPVPGPSESRWDRARRLRAERNSRMRPVAP